MCIMNKRSLILILLCAEVMLIMNHDKGLDGKSEVLGFMSLACDTCIRLYFFLGREILSANICDSSTTKHGKSGSHSVV